MSQQLFGPTRRLLVTRPAAQAAGWVADLRVRGIDAEALPLIEVAPPLDAEPLRAEWRRLAERRLLVFVSPNGVTHFFAARPAGAAWPERVSAAAPGPATACALREHGVPAACVVEPAADSAQFDSEHLWHRLREQSWREASVLIVRGEGGREWLAKKLIEAGARVDFVGAYRRMAPTGDVGLLQRVLGALRDPACPVWLFSSSEAIDNLCTVLAAVDLATPELRRRLAAATVIATHPRIADRASAAGFGCVLASRPLLEAVVACLQSVGVAETPSP